MRLTRVAAAGIAAAVSAVALAACGNGSADSSGPVTITYATVATGDVLAKGENPVIKDFEKANPDIKVKIESIPVANYSTKLTTEFRGGQGPDVGRVNTSDLRTWNAAGFLKPLDSVVSQQKIDTQSLIPNLLASAKISGKQAALPLTTDTRVLYYNPSLLKKQGITAPPTTWAELQADVQKFAGTGVYGYGFIDSGNDYAMSSEAVGPYIMGAKGQLVNADGTKAVAESSQGTLQALQFLQNLVKTGAVPKGGSTTEPLLAQLFSQNKLAFMLGGPWVRPQIQQNNPKIVYGTDYMTTTVPVQKQGDASGSISGGWYVGVFKKSKHQDPAAKLLAFLMQKDNLAKLNVPEGFPPRVDGLNTVPWSSDPFYEAYAKQLAGTGRIIPALAGTHEIAVDFLKAVTPVLLDPSKPASDALKQFDDTVNSSVFN